MLKFRFATKDDVDLYYHWANDSEVRNNSYTQEEIVYENHVKWFKAKILTDNTWFYLFTDEQDKPVGQVRIEKKPEETIIGISIDKNFRGKSLASAMLVMACDNYLNKYPEEEVIAYIKVNNAASLRSFVKAGFVEMGKVVVFNEESYRLKKELK